MTLIVALLTRLSISLAGLVGAVYLAVNDRPWFGFLVLIAGVCGGSFETHTGDPDKTKQGAP